MTRLRDFRNQTVLKRKFPCLAIISVSGVIVTGTCWSGSVKTGDQLLIEPGGAKVRVRGRIDTRPVEAGGDPLIRVTHWAQVEVV